jgi:endo-1,4-beta-xylanase
MSGLPMRNSCRDDSPEFYRHSLRLVSAIVLTIALSACQKHAASSQPPQAPDTLRAAATLHHLTIGTAAASSHLSDPQYSQLLGSEFSQLEPENEMKFASIHPRPDTDPQPYNFVPADALVSFAQAHNMLVRGHTLVWHNQVPDWITKGNLRPDQLADALHRHITTVMQHYETQVYAWDVVNEAFNDDGTVRSTVWYDAPGIGFAGKGTAYIEQALQWAHAANPQAKLFYNDYDTEEINRKSDAIFAMATDFKQRGVPLDGIGFQMHVSLGFDDPAKLTGFAQNLQRFAALGLEIHITELDIRLPDDTEPSLKKQAKLYGEVAAICRVQPACKVIQTWGFTDKYSWIPSFFKGTGWALLWDAGFHKKPAYYTLYGALTQ